jgi:hypothetical protein
MPHWGWLLLATIALVVAGSGLRIAMLINSQQTAIQAEERVRQVRGAELDTGRERHGRRL